MRSPARLVPRVVPVALLLLACVGCTLLPESGPVRRGGTGGSPVGAGSQVFTPPRPGPGDSPVAIVNGFLQALTANQGSTTVARSYLSRTARATWTPSRATIVYAGSAVTNQPGSFEVQARLTDPRRLDSRGGWLGVLPTNDDTLTLRMVREQGQWRIDDPPDAVLVPDSYLDQRYQTYNLYFLDPSEQVLVPDRVYVPRGEQVSSQLVRALLSGPGDQLASVVHSAIPAGYQLNLSVVVGSSGVAEIPLKGPPGDNPSSFDSGQVARMAAQLAWTLRQVPGVQRVRLSVNDVPVTLPDGRREFSVQSGAAYAPSVADARTGLYGLRGGRVVVRNGDVESPVTGSFGAAAYPLRSFAVRLDGGAIAGVTTGGRLLVDRQPRQSTERVPPRVVYQGRSLLHPAYDLFGTLWWVDQAGGAATVHRLAGGRARTVEVPGVSGQAVRSFVVSRSGTSLVAVVRGTKRDQVVAVSLQRKPDGGLSGMGPAQSLESIPTDLRDLREVVWRSPNDLAVLGRLPNGVFETVYLSLDGSPGDLRTVPPDSWRGDVVGLVAAPDSRSTTYLELAGGQLLRLDDSSRWRASGIAKGLTAATYVG